jgi:hypothetical protein
MKARSLLTLGLIACTGDATDLASQFPETPFRQIPGVEIGMTGKRLQSLRPAAKYSPYLGMQEAIPGYVVSYSFPGSQNDSKDAAIGEQDKLEGVFISQPFTTKEDAEKTWREKVIELTERHRAPSSCDSLAAGGLQARWRGGTNTLSLGVFPVEAMSPAIGNRVIYAFQPTSQLRPLDGVVKISCPGH